MSETVTTRRPARLWVLVVALLLAVAGLAWQLARTPVALPLFDFVEYWAAGHLNAAGANPYDPDLVHELERQTGRTEPGVLMWNPPWTLTLVMPFGVLPVRLAHVLWLLMQFAALGLAADLLWRLYGGDAGRRWLAWLVAFTFLPSLFALTAGQISPLILLGAVPFLACLRAGRFAWAGAACVLLAVKPHLALLFWVALLLWAVRERRWSLLAGGTLAGVVCTLVPLLFNPGVLGQYWQTLTTRPPAQYRSPTLGTLLRLALGEEAFALQFVSVVPGLAWLAWHWHRRRQNWDWGEELPLLLLVSVVTAPYGAWPFDLVLLLPAVVAVAAGAAEAPGKRVAAVALYAAVNAVVGWQIARGVEFLAFVWVAPVLLAGFLALRPRKRTSQAGFSRPRFDCSPGTT